MKKSFSIVSHGQGFLVKRLLETIKARNFTDYEIIITLNIQENEDFLNSFFDLPITVIRNQYVKGYGANHNAAFDISTGEYFFVINPDIEFLNFNLCPIFNFFNSDKSVGVCAPVVISRMGDLEDSARFHPTFFLLFKRVLRKIFFLQNYPDYVCDGIPIKVDWVAGMFQIFRREAFLSVSGFDEKYFMYYEDADICRRLQKNGWAVYLHPEFTVVHQAQRASLKKLSHFKWHLSSTLRILFL